MPRFVQAMEDWCQQSTITNKWTELPDLYIWLREVLFQCGVASVFGPHMLRLNPDLSEDFWEYDDNIDFLALGMPN